MGFMIFDDYPKTQERKMRLFAESSRGIVLDVGGSENPNHFLDASNAVREVYLLDIKEPDTSLPRKYRNFIKFDLNEIIERRLPFNEGFFDTIILGDVLEHLYHPLALLHDAKRILKDDGVLLISLPTPKYYIEVIHNLLFSKPMGFPEHKILFTRTQMKQFLEILGFKIAKIIGYSFWIPLLKIGFVNTKYRVPELMTWQQIYVCLKAK
jgi:SAM-dependent methyltransferase